MVRIPLLMVAVWALMALSLGGALPGPALAATITVNTFTDELNADGDCSLREAVVAANTNAAVDSCTAGSGADTINLQTGNYALMLAGSEDAAANGDLDLIGTVTIAGVNTTVKTIPATTDRVFHVLAGATADISGVNVEGGQGGAGGGILILGTLTLSNSTVRLNTGGNGAGVYNAGTLTVNSSTIENNIGSLNGAGIYNNGTATVDGSTVSGNTASTDGGGIYSAGGSVTLTDSTVSGNDASQAGGGVNIQAGTFTLNNSTVSGNDGTLGGGIYKFGTVAVPVPVTLNGSTVSGNGASSTQGGGIYSAGGLVTLNDSTVSTNTASAAGGGVYTVFGATLTVNDSTVSGNSSISGSGGGIYGASGSFTELTNSTVSGNSAAGGGGGIYSGQTLFVSSSNVSGNSANSDGGGVKVDNGTLWLSGSTVSGNSAGLSGGGVHSENSNVTLSNSTISGNIASSDGGGLYADNSTGYLTSSTLTGNRAGNGFFGGGIYKDLGGAVTLTNSIVANSPSGGNCFGDPLTSNGYNLSSDSSCNLVNGSDKLNTNPQLGPLANNGGPTRTHALLAGSPAIEAGFLTFDGACSGGDDFDQRGVARPQGLRCDIGAYEADDTDGDGVPDPLDLDDDDDTVPDALDSCPLAAEDIDGYEDGDGCADTDNDVDGVCDPGLAGLSCVGSDSGKRCFDPAGTLSCPTQDCRNVAEDVDAFKDGDGCPEPDNDNDGQADGDDDCDGTDAQAGTDGMLGSPQDANHNGISNGAEGPLTTDDVVKTFEDYDGVLDGDGCHDSPMEDFDSDGYTDDNEAGFPLCGNGKNDDNLDDGVMDDGCPGGPAAAGTFSEGEARIGTNPGYPCGISSWPSDTYSEGLSANKLDVQDIISFIAPDRRLDKSPPNALYSARWDLAPGANEPFPSFISIFDITTMLNGTPGSPACPPMFSGPRAFGRVCPLAAQ